MVKTSDGGYAIVGMAYENGGDVTGNHGVADYWVVKINSLGTLQWQKSLGGSSADYGSSIKQTSDLGFIVVGSSESNDGDVTGNHGAKDYWVIKLNSTGNILWSKSFGGTNDDIANSVYQTNDGGYIVGGYSNSNNGDVTGNHGGYDYWVIKIDSNGFIQWQKSYGGTGNEGTSNTGSSYRPFSSISQTSNNGDVIGNHGANDYLIINADENGTILWQKCFGGSLDDNPFSVTQTNDGGFIIAGTTFSNDGNIQGFYDYADYWIVKTDENGTLLWQKCYGGLSNDRAYCIRQTIDGGFILAGFTYSANGDVTSPSSNNINDPSFSEGWIVKINSSGFIEWNKIVDYPAPSNAYSILQTTDGGYIAIGLSLSGGFFAVKLQSTIGLIDLDDAGSKIYPNPANNTIVNYIVDQ